MNLEKELLGFMSEWKHWTSQEIFIDSFRNFLSLVSKEKEISIVLLSFPVENKDYSKTVRILYENKISDKKIQKFSQLKLSEVNKNNIINKDNYSIFSLGKRKDQEIICAVDDLSSFFDASILEILLKYMRGGFQYLNQLVDKSVLLSLAYTDDVTGFYNQRKLGKDLSRLIEQFKRFQNNFSVLFIDIDHFKNVNDSHGHVVGSQLLKQVANVIKDSLRDEDSIYRYGGDEFVVILPGSNLENSEKVGGLVGHQLVT